MKSLKLVMMMKNKKTLILLLLLLLFGVIFIRFLLGSEVKFAKIYNKVKIEYVLDYRRFYRSLDSDRVSKLADFVVETTNKSNINTLKIKINDITKGKVISENTVNLDVGIKLTFTDDKNIEHIYLISRHGHHFYDGKKEYYIQSNSNLKEEILNIILLNIKLNEAN